MIALMNDSSSGALGFVPPIPPSRPHAGQPYLAWKQANSSAMRREPAVSAHMDGCPIRPRWRRVSSSCPVHKERRRELVLMKLSYRVICETACRVREYNSREVAVLEEKIRAQTEELRFQKGCLQSFARGQSSGRSHRSCTHRAETRQNERQRGIPLRGARGVASSAQGDRDGFREGGTTRPFPQSGTPHVSA